MLDFNTDDLNLDGLIENPMLSLGNPNRDVEVSSSPTGFHKRRLTPDALEDLYVTSKKCQRVCRKIPTQIVRAGWEVQLVGDATEAQQQAFKKDLPAYMRKAKLGRMIIDAMTWANLYNEGAGILLDVQDGQTRDKPVRIESIKSVKPMFVLDGETLDAVREGSATGEVDYFVDSLDYEYSSSRANPDSEERFARERETRGQGNIVHPSRVMWFEGVPTPPRAKSRMDGSVGRLQQFWNSLQRYESGLQALNNNLQRQQTLMMGMQGMMEMMAATGGKSNQEQLKAQMEAIFYMANNLGMVAYDMKRQKFDILKRDVSSFPPALKLMKEDMVSESGLSEMALFGITNVGSGLSGQDMRDRLAMAENVADVAEDELRGPLEMFLTYAMHAKDGPTGGKSPEDWVLTFKSSLTLTPKEQSDLRSQQANTDKIYTELRPEVKDDILISRFGSGEWSGETQLPNPLPKAAPPPAGLGGPGAVPGEVPAEGQETEAPPTEEVSEEDAAKSFAEEVLGGDS